MDDDEGGGQRPGVTKQQPSAGFTGSRNAKRGRRKDGTWSQEFPGGLGVRIQHVSPCSLEQSLVWELRSHVKLLPHQGRKKKKKKAKERREQKEGRHNRAGLRNRLEGTRSWGGEEGRDRWGQGGTRGDTGLRGLRRSEPLPTAKLKDTPKAGEVW